MTSMAWEAMQMGLDPVCGPDGRLWEESLYKRPEANKDIWGDDDGDNAGKIDMARYEGSEWEDREMCEEHDFHTGRQIEIIEWLSSTSLAKNFRARDGFFVAQGSQVNLKGAVTRDLFEWLTSEGIHNNKVIGPYRVDRSSPDSKYGERFSFFKYVIDAPFEPLSDGSYSPIPSQPDVFDDDIPF